MDYNRKFCLYVLHFVQAYRDYFDAFSLPIIEILKVITCAMLIIYHLRVEQILYLLLLLNMLTVIEHELWYWHDSRLHISGQFQLGMFWQYHAFFLLSSVHSTK